jgi:hypothetical protein
MRWLAVLLSVAGCTFEFPSGGPSADDSPPDDYPPEIDGEYLNPQQGACYGDVGGEIRCSGSTCIALDEPSCGARPDCFIAYMLIDTTETFRACFPAVPSSAAGGECSTLDAFRCVRRADCATVYGGFTSSLSFARCEPDPFDLTRT